MRILAPSCDHKRAFDGDEGPNTGGMGVYTPTTRVDAAMMAQIEETIVLPAVREMAKRGNPLRGVLYPGLMMTPDGPKVIEFNARFGDPETQVVLPTTVGDLGAWVLAVAKGTLGDTPQPAQSGAAVGIALASGGYPGSYQTGFPIHGLDDVASDPDVIVFHAGTKRTESRGGRDGRWPGAHRGRPRGGPGCGAGQGVRRGGADHLRRADDAVGHRRPRAGRVTAESRAAPFR